MNTMQIYGRSDTMFKKLTLQEQLQLEKEKNILLLQKQAELEDALVELAEIIATNEEMINNG